MAYKTTVNLPEHQLERDNDLPRFAPVIRERLHTEYPGYTLGTWVEYEGDGYVQWSLAAVAGIAGGFRVMFQLPSHNPNAATLKVTRHSRILGILVGLSVVVGLLIGIGMMITGQKPVIWAFLLTTGFLAMLSYLVSGVISRVLGKALSKAELDAIGNHVLIALGEQP